MNKDKDSPPALPPRLPLPNYPTRRTLRKSSLDVVPPVPHQFKTSNLKKREDLLNLPIIESSLIESSDLQNRSPNSQPINIATPTGGPPTAKSASPILNCSSLSFSNQLNSINNNYYGINCNYFTAPPNMLNANGSLSSSTPSYNLSHSNSFPNFTSLNGQLPPANELNSARTNNNHSSSSLTSSSFNALLNRPPPANNQLTNRSDPFNTTAGAAPKLDHLGYQQFVLSKLQTISKENNNFKKLSNDNLIDLGQRDDLLDSQSSVLHLFDPLVAGEPKAGQQNEQQNEQRKEQQRDQQREQRKEQQQAITYSTIRPTIVEEDELTSSLKSIQLKAQDQLTEENFYESINYEKPAQAAKPDLVKKEIVFNNNKDFLKQRNRISANAEIINFKSKLLRLRRRFSFDQTETNRGFVISSRLNSPKDICLSVKLIIDSEFAAPICFTCNVSTSVEHVVCHTVCSIFDSSTVDFSSFILKVFGLNEFLVNESCLGDYAYVTECHKFGKDVKLTLIDRSANEIGYYARTEADDELVEHQIERSVLPGLLLDDYNEINYNMVEISLNAIDTVAMRLLSNSNRPTTPAIEYFDTGKFLRTNQPETSHSLLISVNQAVKALCTYLGFETTQLLEAQNNLRELYLICELYKTNSQDNKLNDTIEMVHPEIIGNAILSMKKAIYVMLHLYSRVFPVDFYVELPDSERRKDEQRTPITIQDCQDSLICKIDNLNGLHCDWSTKFALFYFRCELIHGERVLDCVQSQPVPIKNLDKSPRIDFDEYINFEQQLLCSLPRETYLYFTLVGVPLPRANEHTTDLELNERELGLAAIRLFDHQNTMIEGMHLLGLWPDKYCSPVYKPVIRESFLERNCPLLVFSLINTDHVVRFPELNYSTVRQADGKASLNMFDVNDHAQIYHILNQDPLDQLTYEDKQTLWEKRHNLTDVPSALPKVLSSAPSWQSNCLLSTYKLIKKWSDLTAIDALQLLLPSYADIYVRETAVNYIRKLDDDEIYDYLPQLVHAIRYETNLDSPLVWLLFEKAFSNLRIAHHLYWLLKTGLKEQLISWRMQLLLSAFLATCSASLRQTLENEEKLLKMLNNVSEALKKEKDDRLKSLRENLEQVHKFIGANRTSLPLNLNMLITGIDLPSCNFFNSNTLPIKVAFKTEVKRTNPLAVAKLSSSPSIAHATTIDALYKIGDDLRQDSITMQMIEIMDKLWLKEGLDLKLITFKCIATDDRKGFVEMVKNSETLRKIQGEKGVTGSFNVSTIANWLQKYNTSELEYEQAVNNFTASCAGYAVATYVLGIGDRHNDNIMVTTSGHIFHIDFGKFLGDAQMLGSIKRDRVPFVLTSDMAFVINNGDKVSVKFQNFIDLCCQAYNIIRQNSNLFLSLFSLMLSANIPGLTMDAIKYVHNALKPTLTNCKASEEFNKLIIEALSSKSAQINFFIHNLSQMRFSSDINDQKTLSFAPKIHTIETEDPIRRIHVQATRKLLDTNKQYYYEFLVYRVNQKDPQIILRTYKEVYELNQKLSTFFRLAKFYPLPRPKSNSRDFTEKKIDEIRVFFEDLMQTANEILHSDLIYTFFHPLLRDQESLGESSSSSPLFRGTLQAGHNIINRANHSGNGEIKLSLLFKNNCLKIMIMHARNLYSMRTADPDTYVKTYLLPDPYKQTKRKTKVIYKSKHPTFMEMITYESIASIEELYKISLEVSVWYYLFGDREKKLLGAALIQLRDLNLLKESAQWYPLTTSKN